MGKKEIAATYGWLWEVAYSDATALGCGGRLGTSGGIREGSYTKSPFGLQPRSGSRSSGINEDDVHLKGVSDVQEYGRTSRRVF